MFYIRNYLHLNNLITLVTTIYNDEINLIT
ncbi:MAG: hypothetical protein BWY70_00950 [Bacteroidetes bacterium ADurb.Bin408]|nr:MAG: hypothetical protein BWY70_00950 [Bacteroidetes bacterium ADurb.Bin408]